MRFVKENTGTGIAVPAAVLRLSGMGEEPRLELHVLDKAVLLLEERMTAMELVTAIHSLYRQTLDLLAHLAEVCGSWEDCGEYPEVPKEVREAAEYDLRDVPPCLLELLASGDVCLGALEEHLVREDVVYG